MTVNEKECDRAGKDIRKVEALVKEFSALGRRAKALGVYVFGGSGSGTIRCSDPISSINRPLILASIDGVFDGGDGATGYDSEGLERGE